MAGLRAADGYLVVADSEHDPDALDTDRLWPRRIYYALGAAGCSLALVLLAVATVLAGSAPQPEVEAYPSGSAEEEGSAPIDFAAVGAVCGKVQQGLTYKTQFGFAAPSVLSQQECCARCQGTPPCSVWLWLPGLSQCWLKGGHIIGQMPLSGAVVGSLPERKVAPGLTEFRFSYQVVHHDPKSKPLAFGCQAKQLPVLWHPQKAASPIQLKVMSYNLEWWKLFDQVHAPELNFYRATKGNPGTQLIAHAAAQGAYDIMGFQECADGAWLAAHSNLGAYTMLSGDDGRCMAFKKEAWSLVASGQGNVAEDTLGLYYGKRGAQWMRLRSVQTGAMVFFMNHHGPLPTNSGGACGGAATAYNLLQMIAVNGRGGDAVILAGDFNANAGGLTIKTLGTRLAKATQGTADGGVDFMFTNNVPLISKMNLGSGGSDHEALGVTFNLGA